MTHSPERIDQRAGSRRRRGFSLAEVIIAAGIFGLVVAGLMSSFTFVLRSSIGMGNYVDMNAATRHALEMFAQDVRMASGLTAISETELTLTVPSGSSTSEVTYRFYNVGRSLEREEGGTTLEIMGHLEEFQFSYYNLDDEPTLSLLEVKSVQIEALAVRKVLHLENTNMVVSSRHVMRNRRVAN